MLKDFIAVDIETTGLSPEHDQIIEIGALRYRNGLPAEEFKSFLAPGRRLSEQIIELTGITDEMLFDAPKEAEVIESFLSFAGQDALLGHNIVFDYSFLKTAVHRNGKTFERKGIDTLRLSKKLHPELKSKSLASMCSYYGIINEQAHRALQDAKAAAELYTCCMEEAKEEEAEDLFDARPLVYKVKKREPITQKQVSFLSALLTRYGIPLEKKMDELSKSEASKLIDTILASYGR